MPTHRLAREAYHVLPTRRLPWSEIWASRRSHHFVLLRAVTDRLAAMSHEDDAAWRHNYAALAELERSEPDAVGVALSDPSVGAWLDACLNQLKSEEPASARRTATLCRLGAIAIGVALRTGRSTTCRVPVEDSAVHIPLHGRMLISSAATTGLLALHVEDGRLELPGVWQPVRHLEAIESGRRITVALDDLDPHRLPLGEVQSRLDNDDFETWNARFAEAWRLLIRAHPNWADAIARGVRALVPMQPGARGEETSSVAYAAPGRIGLSLPASPARFAAALIHEVQHGRLYMLHDVRALYRSHGSASHYSPWRNDPRPVSAILHGMFAFAGVGSFWSAARWDRSGEVESAEWHLARISAQLRFALDEVAPDEGDLTRAGHRILDDIRRVASRLSRTQVDGSALAAAGAAARTHRVAWRLRNLSIDPAALHALVNAWPARPTGRSLPAASVTPAPARALRFGTEAGTNLDHAAGWLVADRKAGTDPDHLADRLVADRDDGDAWLALGREGSASKAFGDRPELIYDLLGLLPGPPDPRQIADWLDSAA